MTGESGKPGQPGDPPTTDTSATAPQRDRPSQDAPAAAARPASASRAATPSIAPPLPPVDASPTETVWDDYFAQHRPAPGQIVSRVDELLTAKRHDQIVALLEAALIHEQSQPWMYEALAASMEAVGRPQAEIERVVLSLADFGGADFDSLTFSAAYLVRLGRDAAGLKLYQEASRRLPEQPEPYLLGLRLARKLKDVDSLQWATTGVLQHVWTRDQPRLHREAENAAAEALQRLDKAAAGERAAALRAALAEARRRDLAIRLVWSGEGDLDLLVEEPSRAVCSFLAPATPGGGTLTHQGHGPDPANSFEEYVCALGQSGEYRITVRHAFGAVVGNRATLTIIRDQGGPGETIDTRSVVLGADEPVVRVTLDQGRRRQLRAILAPGPVPAAPSSAAPLSRPKLPPKAPQARADFEASRGALEGVSIRRTGAVGFQPVIQIVPDGATFSARAVVSPDRRYVRIGVAPAFSNVTDVFTFSFFNSGPLGNVQPGVAGN